MSTFLIIFIPAAVGIVFIIGRIILALNDDDGQPWPHDTTGNEHQWKQ